MLHSKIERLTIRTLHVRRGEVELEPQAESSGRHEMPTMLERHLSSQNRKPHKQLIVSRNPNAEVQKIDDSDKVIFGFNTGKVINYLAELVPMPIS